MVLPCIANQLWAHSLCSSSLKIFQFIFISICSYGIREESLAMMRYSKYMEMAAIKDGIKTESLSHSEHVAYQHSCRVFLQVMDWRFLEEAHHNPVSWGWTLQNGLYHPIFSDQPPAPDDLLNVVRFKCKLTSKNYCSTNCSCKEMGYIVLQLVVIVVVMDTKMKIQIKLIWSIYVTILMTEIFLICLNNSIYIYI